MSGIISVEMIREREAQGVYIGWAANRYRDLLARGDLDICAYCERMLDDTNRTIDHIQPKSKGGGNNLGNLCLSCSECNHKKGDQSIAEFRGVRLMERPYSVRGKKKKRGKTCPLTCQCDCHEPLPGNPHHGQPCPGKAEPETQPGKPIETLEQWEEFQRREDRKRFHEAEMTRMREAGWEQAQVSDGVRRNWKGLPDP